MVGQPTRGFSVHAVPVSAAFTMYLYSSPPLIRPPYLLRDCGHIREVAFGAREKCIHSSSSKNS